MFIVNVIAARVGPSVPRQERPARDGARVASIETGLAAAAAKLSHQVCPPDLSLIQRLAISFRVVIRDIFL